MSTALLIGGPWHGRVIVDNGDYGFTAPARPADGSAGEAFVMYQYTRHRLLCGDDAFYVVYAWGSITNTYQALSMCENKRVTKHELH